MSLYSIFASIYNAKIHFNRINVCQSIDSSLGCTGWHARGIFLDTLECGVEEACTPGFATLSSGALLDEPLLSRSVFLGW